MQSALKVIQRDTKVKESTDYICPVLQPREHHMCSGKDLLKKECQFVHLSREEKIPSSNILRQVTGCAGDSYS